MINRNIHIRADYEEYRYRMPGGKISVYSVFLSEYTGKYERFLYGNRQWNDMEWENIATCEYNPIGYINCIEQIEKIL